MVKGWQAIAALVLIAVAVTVGGCDSPESEVQVTTPTTSAADGDVITYGEIERGAGGTAVVRSEYIFVSAACESGILTLNTTAASFSGTMDCSTMPGEDILGRFAQKAIAITVGNGRLKIENPEAGSLDFPAINVTS